MAEDYNDPEPIEETSFLDVIREVMLFSAIISALVGLGYGLFLGFLATLPSKADPDKILQPAYMIPVTGALWMLLAGIGGSIACGLFVAVVGGAFRALKSLTPGRSRSASRS
jgi:hypothetical protein